MIFLHCGRLIGCAVVSVASGPVRADYPDKPLRLIVPCPEAGANGIIGADLVAKAKPDGYTVLITIAPHAINATLYAKLPYDTNADLAPVSCAGALPDGGPDNRR